MNQKKDEEIELSENSQLVLEKRYLRTIEGKTETPKELFRRVARSIASVDLLYEPGANIKKLEEDFYKMMIEMEFLPNSPTLMNAGTDGGQLSACFVLPIEDAMESIFEAIKNTALIHKSGGGTGFSFSKLRPAHDIVHSTGGVASGPVSFMKVFDSATEAVKQGGARRGANMGILRVDHPDIMEFITSKEDERTLNNFNISVGVTNAFMEAVEEDKDIELINPRNQKVVKSISAREIFALIVKQAWKNGEPGIIFLDAINMDNPTPELGEIESTNPCGEQPLYAYESCNLGSINLSEIVKDGKIDYDHLKRIVHLAVHFLDNVIDINCFPLEKMEEMTKKNRKIGLGVMGFADMLIMLGVAYNSEEALRIAEEVMQFINAEAYEASVNISKERGSFPNIEKSTYPDKGELRNAARTTIAPTGSLSIIANCSSGIEPLFAIAFERKKIFTDVRMIETNQLFEEISKQRGFYTLELMKEIAITGSVQGMKEVPLDIQKIFVTSHDISPEWHVRMQAAFQKHTDNAVSKTVNLRNSATEKDVEDVFKLAYALNCKGITIYRDRSREEQVLNKIVVKEDQKSPRRRPELTVGGTMKVATGCGNLYVTINEDEHGLCEVFVRMGKSGGCISSHSEAIGRLISLALRSGVDIESVIKQLKGIRCPKIAFHHNEKVLSCADAVQIAIRRYINDGPSSVQLRLDQTGEGLLGRCPECPECGAILEMQEGCLKCRSCGYTEC